MKNYLKKYSSLIALALLFVAGMGLTLNADTADSAEAEAVDSKKGDFIRGAKLWADTCVRCHNMRDPKDQTDEEWRLTAFHMRVRAGLTGQDTRDILEFLQKSN